MEADENINPLQQLLAKRKKLIERRQKITSHKSICEVETKGDSKSNSNARLSTSSPRSFPLSPIIINKESQANKLQSDLKPATPYSNAQPSISPPALSPLTPLINTKSQESKSQGGSKPATPYSNAQPSISPPAFSPLTPLINTKIQESKSQGGSKPATPYSNAQPSISPPAFSPLTPLINTKSQESKSQGGSKPATPYSNAQPSISPPTFSPLTPLIINTEIQKNKLPGKKSDLAKSLPQIQQAPTPTCSPLEFSTNIETSPLLSPTSSPLPPMSPETQRVFNILTQQVTINTNCEDNNRSDDENAPDILCDSDDSVKDHYTSLHNKETIVYSSTSSCSYVDDSNGSINNTISNEDLHINEELTEPTETETGRPKRGRKRKHPQSRTERNYNKYNNLEYTTNTNKTRKPKKFIDYQCKCSKKCASLISVEKRKEEFDKFIRIGSYNAQVAYIGSCIKEKKKKRTYTMTNVPPARKKPKQFSRTYTICGIKVCRDMFLKTFQMSTQKVTVSLRKLRGSAQIKDGRGNKTGGRNKVMDQHNNFIIDIITKLPKYESHYRRENNHDALYLQPGMTLNKIYDIYRQEYKQKYGDRPKYASIEYVKKIFYSKFNLKCKTLKKDTCNRCDKLAVTIQNAKSTAEKEQAQEEKNRHLEMAENLRNQMNRDFEQARNSPSVECLTFDLEKTLPLPRIPTNVVFYKRQLWFYNSGIHSASNDIGHCYVWVEGEAGRGAQEVGSCLKKYINQKLNPTVEHLILWSDCCGGQNRNIKIVLMLKIILNSHPTLKTISLRFLESGHTFLPNDTDFSKIETALKQHQRIYTAEEYIDVIKHSKKSKPLQVYKMQKTDFYSTKNLEKNITNRKKFTDKSKVSWLDTKEIKIENHQLLSILMRPSLEKNYKELSIKKIKKGETRTINESDLCLLWPDGKPIAPAKLADLQSMYHYIPEDCLAFYKKLKSSEDIIDDVDGFGGEPDFDLEGYEE